MIVTALLLSLAAQETVVVTANPEAKPERKICRQVGNSTGSRMGGARECKTKSEWAALQDPGDNEKLINDMMNNGGFNAGGMNTREPTRAMGR